MLGLFDALKVDFVLYSSVLEKGENYWKKIKEERSCIDLYWQYKIIILCSKISKYNILFIDLISYQVA